MKEINRKMSLRQIRAMRNIVKLDISPYTATKSDSLLLVDDPTEGSDFFFEITDVDADTSDDIYFLIRYAPRSDRYTDVFESKVVSGAFPNLYNDWKALVQEYNQHMYDHVQESIVEGYEEEYFDDFNIVDDDADTHSYSQQAQTNIDDFLAKVSERLRRYKEEEALSEEVLTEIDVLLADIESLRNTQTRQTKRSVFRQVINVVARSRKAAPKLAWEITVELLKSILIDGIKDSPKYLDTIKGFLES